MQFCPKCGSLLRTKTVDKKLVNTCSCGYKKKLESTHIIKETVVEKNTIFEISGVNPLATSDNICAKCGFDKAILVDPQITVRDTSGDTEADKPAYICGKCGHKEFL